MMENKANREYKDSLFVALCEDKKRLLAEFYVLYNCQLIPDMPNSKQLGRLADVWEWLDLTAVDRSIFDSGFNVLMSRYRLLVLVLSEKSINTLAPLPFFAGTHSASAQRYTLRTRGTELTAKC